MKLVAVDRTDKKITLIYSEPESEEMPSYEFRLDDPELEEKLKPHMDQKLLQKHLKSHPPKLVGKPKQAGDWTTTNL